MDKPLIQLVLVVLALMLVAVMCMTTLSAQAHTKTGYQDYLEIWATEHTEWDRAAVIELRQFVDDHQYLFTRHQATPSVHRGMGADVEQWRDLAYSFFGDEVETALAVMACESGGNPYAVSRTNDHGLMQINYPTWGGHFGLSKADLYDPTTNLWVAKQIRDIQGWNAWTAYRRGCR